MSEVQSRFYHRMLNYFVAKRLLTLIAVAVKSLRRLLSVKLIHIRACEGISQIFWVQNVHERLKMQTVYSAADLKWVTWTHFKSAAE